MAHLSIHWDTENGIKPANKTCQYINDAMDYVNGVRYFLGDDTPDVIIMLHTDNHDDKPTVYMTIGGDGVPTLESETWR